MIWEGGEWEGGGGGGGGGGGLHIRGSFGSAVINYFSGTNKQSCPNSYFFTKNNPAHIPATSIFTYKRQTKYPTHTFIQNHTVIWATWVGGLFRINWECVFGDVCDFDLSYPFLTSRHVIKVLFLLKEHSLSVHKFMLALLNKYCILCWSNPWN